ncbi:cholesterol esterase [Elasticomyces elasticus]|nr:cholesterol esterase [Elasticomyces elasticus]KAK3650461.1 cholesterol esterase [Elasticomyces elasticus]KAK4921805.1 cholesterol esterase [Elasticomyces elasticus]KAK5753413.1 cholesterol esterase [Elasticomyces elasticus]
MATLPFIGRLHGIEYLNLLLSFTLLFVEGIVRSITLLLPSPIIRLCYGVSRTLFNALSSPLSRSARKKKKNVSSPIAHAQDFVELCELFGYYAEEHIVQTGDGYLLGVHRLGWKKGEEDQRVNAGPGSIQKKVVYLHHGLLMNSEVWVCLTEEQRCLPFVLVEQGYDVWLGNNRGNKYSKKSLHSTPTSPEFWNFSMDQFAFHDIPDSIDYILSTTGQSSLSYIGFSQGTAQAFATLSIHPTLNAKINVFVALAPALAPPGLASGIVASLCKSNPSILFLAFGRRAILGSATMWQALLYPGIFAWFIDKCLLYLFNWKTLNITAHQKLAAYPHLYSFTSTKSVVHWFQIIRNGTFQMYDDEVSTPLAVGNGSQYYKVAKFPTRNIKTPIVLVYGGSDSLVDIKLMLKELPRHTVAKGIQKYEHLDLLWASDVDELVFPHVLEALDSYAGTAEKPKALGWAQHRITASGSQSQSSPNGSAPPEYEEDSAEVGLRSDGLRSGRANVAPTPGEVVDAGTGGFDFGLDERPASTTEEHLDESDDVDEGPERFALTPASNNVATPYGNDSLPHRRAVSVNTTASTPSPNARSTPPRTRLPVLGVGAKTHARSSSLASDTTARQTQPHSPTTTGRETPLSPFKGVHSRRILSPRLQGAGNIQQRKRTSTLSDDASTVRDPGSPQQRALASPTGTDGSGFGIGRHPRPEGWWSSTSTSSSPSGDEQRPGDPDGTGDGEHDVTVQPGQPIRLKAEAKAGKGLLGHPAVAVTTGVFKLQGGGQGAGKKRKGEGEGGRLDV